VLRSLVDLFIAFTDLLRAYAYELQESVKATAIKVGVLAGLGIIGLVVAGSFAFFATGAIMWALYLALFEPLGPAWAGLVTGLIVYLVMGVGIWLGVRQVLR
jgi:hypothetical protein